jgi:hypothetical protein
VSEEGRERLLNAILAALGINRPELSWVAEPESQELAELQHRARAAATAVAPHFALQQVVRIATTRPQLVGYVGQTGVVVAVGYDPTVRGGTRSTSTSLLECGSSVKPSGRAVQSDPVFAEWRARQRYSV